MINTIETQPPIGFILEGKGELNSFPSLVNRILGVSNMHVPRSLAGGSGGYGRIISDLPEEIRIFLRIYHPYSLFICLDLIDILDEKIVQNCSELLTLLESKIISFKNNYDPNCVPLPYNFVIVLQIPKFESWMIADITNLIDSGLVDNGIDPIDDVDNTIFKPYDWLRCNLSDRNMDPKNPSVAKRILSVQDPIIMKSTSKSFDKFYREVTKAYNLWKKACE